MAKSENKNKSFVPNLVQSGNCVFEDLTVRGSLTLSGDKKLVLNNKNGKNLILKCNDFGNLTTDLTGDITGNVTGNLTGNVTGGEIYGTNINGEVGAGHTFYGKRVGGIISPGTPVQTVYGKSTTQVAVNSAKTYMVIQSVNLETIESGSMFYINAYAHGYSPTNSPSTRANLGYSITIDGTTTRIAGKDGASGDSWGTQLYPGAIYSRPAMYAPDIAIPAGTTCTFNLLAASWDVSNSIWNYTGYGHESIIVVSEIPEQAFGFGFP